MVVRVGEVQVRDMPTLPPMHSRTVCVLLTCPLADDLDDGGREVADSISAFLSVVDVPLPAPVRVLLQDLCEAPGMRVRDSLQVSQHQQEPEHGIIQEPWLWATPSHTQQEVL